MLILECPPWLLEWPYLRRRSRKMLDLRGTPWPSPCYDECRAKLSEEDKGDSDDSLKDKTIRLVARGSERTNFPRDLLILCNIFLTELPPTSARTCGLATHIHCSSRKWRFWRGWGYFAVVAMCSGSPFLPLHQEPCTHVFITITPWQPDTCALPHHFQVIYFHSTTLFSSARNISRTCPGGL